MDDRRRDSLRRRLGTRVHADRAAVEIEQRLLLVAVGLLHLPQANEDLLDRADVIVRDIQPGVVERRGDPGGGVSSHDIAPVPAARRCRADEQIPCNYDFSVSGDRRHDTVPDGLAGRRGFCRRPMEPRSVGAGISRYRQVRKVGSGRARARLRAGHCRKPSGRAGGTIVRAIPSSIRSGASEPRTDRFGDADIS